MTYREFVEQMKAATTEQARLIRDGHDIVPMVYLAHANVVQGIPVEAAWFTVPRPVLVRQVVALVTVLDAEYVAWTFTGRRGSAEGEWDHETAVALCIERERHETWLARLVRHDNRATLGAWRSWPANQQEGSMLTPIQEVLR